MTKVTRIMELVEALTCNMQSKARGSTVFLFTTKDGAHVSNRLAHEIEITRNGRGVATCG